MDGLKLAQAVHERCPPIRVILGSGRLKAAKADISAGSRFSQSRLRPDMIAECGT
jgi:hypothetical protein